MKRGLAGKRDCQCKGLYQSDVVVLRNSRKGKIKYSHKERVGYDELLVEARPAWTLLVMIKALKFLCNWEAIGGL